MGHRLLIGREQGDDRDEGRELACFFDSVSGTAFGPVFRGGEHEAEQFEEWLKGQPTYFCPGGGINTGRNIADPSDPRSYSTSELVGLWEQWRDECDAAKPKMPAVLAGSAEVAAGKEGA